MITYNWPIITTYKFILAIFILSINPKAVTIIDITFNSILVT